MAKRLSCPACGAAITVEPGADRTIACPECGRHFAVRRKSAPADTVAPTRTSEEDADAVPFEAGYPDDDFTAGDSAGDHFTPDDELPADDTPLPPIAAPPRPRAPANRPKTPASRPKRGTNAPRPKWPWVLAAGGGGGLLAVGGLVGVLLLSNGSGNAQRQIEEDREALEQAAPVNEFPPVAWTLRPAPGPKLDFPDTLAVRFPNSFAWEVVLPGPGPEYLSVENVGGGSDRAIHFGRFDLQTALPVGPSKRLKDSGNSLQPSAVSPGGTVVIGLSSDRLLQIYDPHEETPRTIPGLSPIDSRGLAQDFWFDFAADDRLWLLKEGSLVAWDLAAGKLAFTASGGRYTLPAMMGPDRTWLLTQVDDKYLEFLDTATGECRGRLGGEGRWQTFAVSPEGMRLVGARFPGNGLGPGAGAYDFPLEIHEWDLRTGERKAVTSLVRKTNDASWMRFIDEDHLLVGAALVDLRRKMHVADVGVNTVNKGYPNKDAGWTSDGRRWIVASYGELLPVAVPLDAIAGEPALQPGDAVRVESHCGDSEIDARVTAAMSGALEKYGFRVEEGGWTLRVTGEPHETKKMLESLTGSTPIPEIKGTVELAAPDATVAATSAHRGVCPLGPGSKYYKGSEQGQIIGQGGTEQYDFGGRSPAAAMREEAWTQFIRTLPDSPWPRAAWKSGDEYVRLPMKIEVDPKPQADR